MTARRRQRVGRGLALAIALCAAACTCAEKPPPRAEALADLIAAEGSVRLTRAGQTSDAKPGPLLEGDALATGEASRAVLRFKGGRELEIGEKARFQLQQGAGEIALEISEGAVVSRVALGAGGGVALAILTPTGLSRVPAEGEATISVGASGTSIEVRTGEITFVTKDGKAQTARSGERLEVSLGTVRIVRPGEAPAAAPDAGASVVQLEAMVFTLTAERGALQVKGPTEARYRPLAKDGEAIAEGTGYRVSPGGRGALEGGGVRVRLAGGSEGVVGKQGRDADGAERFELGLAKGASQIFLKGPGQRVVTLPGPAGAIELAGEGDATVAVTRDGRGARAEVQAGKVDVRYAGETRTLEAGEAAALGKAMTAAPRPPPGLALAAGRRTRVFANGLREVALTWPATGNAARVEVSGDGAFKELLSAGAAVGTQVYAPAPPVGELHWRVLDAAGEALATGRASFAPENVVPMVGGHPINEVAETGLKATVYYQSVLPALVFSFPPAEGAARYRVRVYRADDLKAPMVDKIVAERRCAADPGKLGEGSYLWNATPLGPAGNELAGGRMNKLDIVYDNAMVSLTIQEPAPDAAAAGAEIATRGVAPLGSRLTINGRAAPLDGKGRFELSVPRAPLLVYRLAGADGSESVWLRSVRVR